MNKYYAECEFCGKKKTIVGTPYGCFCKECFLIMIEECKSAIECLNEVGE